jgi:hypothetical protein
MSKQVFWGWTCSGGPGALRFSAGTNVRRESPPGLGKRGPELHLLTILVRIAFFFSVFPRKKPSQEMFLVMQFSDASQESLKTALFFLPSLESPAGRAIFTR